MSQKLKLVKNLLEKRSARRKEGLFVIEGSRLIEEAGERVKFFFYCENLPFIKKLEGYGSVGYKITRKELEEISGVETTQGIIGVVKQSEAKLPDSGVFVYCLGVQDPGNLGTIIRSADAFGASGVILSKGTVDLYNPKVVRATMGSIFHLPIVTAEDDQKTIEQLKRKNVKIIATDISAGKSCFEVNLQGSLAVLVGNEGVGLPKEFVSLADEAVKIPMSGKAESLNVAMSTTVILYEILRQWKTR